VTVKSIGLGLRNKMVIGLVCGTLPVELPKVQKLVSCRAGAVTETDWSSR
jgi:hypothetical protein